MSFPDCVKVFSNTELENIVFLIGIEIPIHLQKFALLVQPTPEYRGTENSDEMVVG